MNGILELIKNLGGGVVESYPQDTQGIKISNSFLYNGTKEIFEKAGFNYEGKKRGKSLYYEKDDFRLRGSWISVSVSGVIFDETGHILLQRHRHWVPNIWGLPGGLVKSGETVEEAFAREVREETNLVVSNIEIIKVVSNYRMRLEIYFQARLAKNGNAQIIKLQEQEVVEARFFSLDELPENILPLQKDIIERAKALAISSRIGIAKTL